MRIIFYTTIALLGIFYFRKWEWKIFFRNTYNELEDSLYCTWISAKINYNKTMRTSISQCKYVSVRCFSKACKKMFDVFSANVEPSISETCINDINIWNVYSHHLFSVFYWSVSDWRCQSSLLFIFSVIFFLSLVMMQLLDEHLLQQWRHTTAALLLHVEPRLSR